MASALGRMERRGWPRRAVGPLEMVCRIRPGVVARVVNLSPGGALVEVRCRLVPGATVEVHLGPTGGRAIVTHAAVARCAVAHLRADGVLYHGGLCFVREIAWL